MTDDPKKEFAYSETIPIPEGGFDFPNEGVEHCEVSATHEGVSLSIKTYGVTHRVEMPHAVFDKAVKIVGRARAARLVATGEPAPTHHDSN